MTDVKQVASAKGLKLGPAVFAAARHISAREARRYALNGVRIKRGGDGVGQAEAIDGRILVRIPLDDYDTDGGAGFDGTAMVIGRECLNDIGHTRKKRVAGGVLEADGAGGGTITTFDPARPSWLKGERKAKLLDGPFPDSADIIPERSAETFSVTLNAGLLMALCKFALEAKGGSPAPIRFGFTDATTPARVEMQTGYCQKIVGAIMPATMSE